MDSIFSKLQSVTENYHADLSDVSVAPKKTGKETKNEANNRYVTHGENNESTHDDLLPWPKVGNIHVPHLRQFSLFNSAASFSADDIEKHCYQTEYTIDLQHLS